MGVTQYNLTFKKLILASTREISERRNGSRATSWQANAVLQTKEQGCLDQAASIGDKCLGYVFKEKWAGIFSLFSVKMRERKESKGTPGLFDLVNRWPIVPFTQKENIQSIGLGDGWNQISFSPCQSCDYHQPFKSSSRKQLDMNLDINGEAR